MTSRAKPRTSSEWGEGFGVVSVSAASVRGLEPSLWAECLRINEVGPHRSGMAGQQVNASAIWHADIANHGVSIRFQSDDWCNRFEPHCLVCGSFDVMQCLRARVVDGAFGTSQYAIDLGLHLFLNLGMFGHQVHHPRQRVCSRIFASKKHGQRVANDFGIGKPCGVVTLGRDHRLKQIGGPGAARGTRGHACPRLSDQAIHQFMDLQYRRVEFAIRG